VKQGLHDVLRGQMRQDAANEMLSLGAGGFYSVPFEEVADLVRGRRVYMAGGQGKGCHSTPGCCSTHSRAVSYALHGTYSLSSTERVLTDGLSLPPPGGVSYQMSYVDHTSCHQPNRVLVVTPGGVRLVIHRPYWLSSTEPCFDAQ
jgi:hypothetical protein